MINYKNGDVIGLLPAYLQKELEHEKRKHFTSMSHFLKRRLKKYMKKMGHEMPAISIKVRPEIMIIDHTHSALQEDKK